MQDTHEMNTLLTTGDLLRTEREQRNISLMQVQAATKIRERFLRIIENSEYNQMTDVTTTSALVASYANYLGLDGRAIAEKFRQEIHGNLNTVAIDYPQPRRVRIRPEWWTLAISICVIAGIYFMQDTIKQQEVFKGWFSDTDIKKGKALPEETVENFETLILTDKKIEDEVQKNTEDDNISTSEEQEIIDNTTPKIAELEEKDNDHNSDNQAVDTNNTDNDTTTETNIVEENTENQGSNIPVESTLPEIQGEKYGAETSSTVLIAEKGDTWIEVRDANNKVIFSGLMRKGDAYIIPEQENLTAKFGMARSIVAYIDGNKKEIFSDRDVVVRKFPVSKNNLISINFVSE